MKKILSLALCLILLLGTLSCAAVTASAAENADQTTEENQIPCSGDRDEEGLSDAEINRLSESIKNAPTESAKSDLAATSAQTDPAPTGGYLDSDFYAYVSSYLGNLYLSYDEDNYDNVIVEPRNNYTRKQIWIFIHISNNIYAIMNKNSGQLLEFSGTSPSNNAKVWTNTYTGTLKDKQLWYISAVKVGDKHYYQFNSYVDQNFDLERESLTSSTVQMYTDSNSTYSLFNIIEIPVITKAEAVSDGVKLQWDSSYTGNLKYRVFRQQQNPTSGNWTAWAKVADTSGYSLVDKTAKGGTVYYYTVRCIDSDGYYVSDYDRYGYRIKYQNIPKLQSIFSRDSYMEIYWDGLGLGSDQVYRIFRKTGSSGWEAVDDVEDDDEYSDEGSTWSRYDYEVTYGTKYTYTVRVYNTITENYDSYFNTSGVALKFFDQYYTVTPKLKSVENTTTGVKLTWSGAVTRGDYYRIFRRTSSGSWAKLKDIAGNNYAHYVNRTYTDTTAKSGTKYYYTVRVVRGSNFVSSYDTTGKAITYIAAPKLTSVYNTSTGVRLNWGKVTGAAKYRVFRKVYNASTGKWSGWTTVGDTSNTYGVDKKVKRNTKYCYTVRCMNSAKTAYTSAYNTTGTTITFK